MRQINLSGTGGQGLITAGIILAEAAILDGKEAVQTQSYGPEARGGASKAEVLISDQPIDYPKALAVDIMLAMSQQASDKYVDMLIAGGQLLVDTTFVHHIPEVDAEILALPITLQSKEKLGNAVFANIIALGALVASTGIVSKDSLVAALLSRIPKGTEERNRQALALGFELVENQRKKAE